MKARELIDMLRLPHEIEFRDKDDFLICITKSNRKGIEPYLDAEIIQWFAKNNCEVMLRLDL